MNENEDGAGAVMNAMNLHFKGLSEEHVAALRWFAENADTVQSWQDIEQYALNGFYLATKAKGIYKPKSSDYALSVRQTLNSPYADKEVIERPDGTWLYPYHQENPEPAARDREATNRGLMNCMRDGVPVGVMIQTRPKPGVQYRILGLGRVLDWKDGYFIIESYTSPQQSIFRPSASLDWVHAEIGSESAPPPPEQDQREWRIRQVLKRRGQAKFREALINAYEGRCAISGCNARDALEAAHITAFSASGNNAVTNGILLRADLHSLFDIGLIGIIPLISLCC